MYLAYLRVTLCFLLVQVVFAADPGTPSPPIGNAAGDVTKSISYALLEDYNKGQDLSEIEADFKLMNTLGINTWRGSFGWDDYEPEKGHYDFTWLHQFASLAQQYGITLRPYIAYTAPWAADGGNSNDYWSYPPKNVEDWYNFLYQLSLAMSVHPNIVSYEIYNEVDSTQWWNGTAAQYDAVLRRGAAAVNAGSPDAQVIMGGLVFPDYDWLNPICSDYRSGGSFQIAPFHAYPETWDDSTVETYLDTQYYDWYIPELRFRCGNQPVWLNELGYATTLGKTRQMQAYWWARAYATFLADAHIQELGIYQIRDEPAGNPVIGGEANYHLGITTVKREPKEAYYTVGMLVQLLPQGTITTADGELTEAVTSGQAVEPYYHLFRRPDGHQIVFAYDKQGTPTVSLTLAAPGSTAVSYTLDGMAATYPSFDGRTLSGVELMPGQISIFEIIP